MVEGVVNKMKNIQSYEFPIIGVGASAGGLAAFESFFGGLLEEEPVNMAFVLIQHLSPDFKSMLTEIVSRYTHMQVVEVTEGMQVEKNCVYIIPPNKDMTISKGILRLFEKKDDRAYHLPIDIFFRSLASDKKEKSICIIMSGTGSDGVLGLKAIKGESGMVMVQSPDEAEFNAMPINAIETGLVDYELSAKEMAKQLISYTTNKQNTVKNELKQKNVENSPDILAIFDLLRTQTGHDFSQYKPNTINRRIERRIMVKQIKDISTYHHFLTTHPDEIKALYNDLLIGVTNFFRDKNAFDYIEQHIIPRLFEGKKPGTLIRVWCSGCSTGEEAYSLAMLLQEYKDKINVNYKIQLFATDIDSRAISYARIGLYPINISSDITPERLERFFVLEPDAEKYRVGKVLRDMIVFSEQSIIKDPPFSKLDLITCRNVLIYFNISLQKKVIPIFHYALNPEGILFLGSSESIGIYDDLFSVLDRKLKVYQKRDNAMVHTASPYGQRTPIHIEPMQWLRNDKSQEVTPKLSMKERLEQVILDEVSVSGVVINSKGDILYIHGKAGRFLELVQGEASVNNLFVMTKGMLKRALLSSIQLVTHGNSSAKLEHVPITLDGKKSTITVSVRAISREDNEKIMMPLYTVLFEDIRLEQAMKQTKKVANSPSDAESADLISPEIEALKEELRIKEERLDEVNLWYESTNEELKSSNEEMQSINEELQSSNEELETSKEELQSINEELSTVNNELQIKVTDLSHINNDMNNLLSGTNIATIFLDSDQNIMRYTPTANKIIHLISTDIGRPLAHIVTNILSYKDLNLDIKYVLDSLDSKTVQVQTSEGIWYNMIIQPYRTIEKIVEGVVITFVDITEIRLAKDKRLVSELQYKTIFETAHEGLMIIDTETGNVVKVNPYLLELSGYSEQEFLGQRIWELGLLKEIIGSEQNFIHFIEEEHRFYEHITLITSENQEIDIVFYSYVYDIGDGKIVQCNLRDK